jgi:TIR domain
VTLQIELLSVGCDLDSEMLEAAETLNPVQAEFRFHLRPSSRRDWGKLPAKHSGEYLTKSLFRRLQDYRIETGGRRPYLVAFINGPLRSQELHNLFACTRASAGLAIVTRHDAERFAPSVQSYVSYHLARCAITFSAPSLRSHAQTRGCYFDRHINKYDLRRSLAAGDLCDACHDQFRQHATPECLSAFEAMALVVARLGFAASAAVVAGRQHSGVQVSPNPSSLERKAPSNRSGPCRLFISYSQADEKACDRLQAHLKVLCRRNLLESWHIRCVPAGVNWADEADKQLDEAEIVILLVSADFLASDYCWEVEMTRALRRHEEKRAIAVPVILRSCLWKEAPIAGLQPLPRNGRPVASWSDPDDAWLEVTEGIHALLQSEVASC